MLRDVDAVLRAHGRYAPGRASVPWDRVALLVAGGGAAYGAAMGWFGERMLQSAYSAAKVPVLLGLSTLICLPNFFVVNALLGLREDFAASIRGVLTAQATVALTLAALAPLTLFLYASHRDYRLAILLNGAMFAVAAAAGQATLLRHYRPLVARNPRHRVARSAWITLYVFVAIQLAWVLRPFVGAPTAPTRFFRDGAWSNAYVVLFDVVRGALGLF